MKIFFCLATFHAEYPDGSTNILISRADACKKQGHSVFFVSTKGSHFFKNNDSVQEFLTIEQALLHKDEDSLYVSSWDWIIRDLVELGVSKNKILPYIQSEHHNHEFNIGKSVVVTNDYIKESIQKRGCSSDIFVVQNGIENYDIPLNKWKTNAIYCCPVKRDIGTLMEFRKICSLPIVEGKYMENKEFIKTMSNYKYFINFYFDEGFGLPPLEAMSVGTVPIIINNHGARSYANSSNAIGLQNNAAIAANMVETLTSEDYKKLQENGIETVKEWTIARGDSQFLEAITIIRDIDNE